jgi:hypothetical protein
MGSCAEKTLSGAVRNFPEFASFRESSRREALKPEGFALLSESSRAPFSGKFFDDGPNGTQWQLPWYWAKEDQVESEYQARSDHDIIARERTFGWLGRNRRLSKDYEGTAASSE